MVNGQLVEREDFGADIEDRAYQFGDGVYEVIRVYGGKVFALEEHLERLWRSCGAIYLALPFEKVDLAGRLKKLVKADNLADGAIYLQISRGVAPRIHNFPKGISPQVVAYTRGVERSAESAESGEAVTCEDIRWLRCDIKSLNLLGNVLAKQEAVEKGAAEAIMHRGDVVTEGSSSNVFIVMGGEVYTHPLSNLILGGITREIVISLANELKLSLRQQAFTVKQAYAAEEAFITSTIREILPIVRIDGLPIGSGAPGPVTRQLQRAFREKIDAFQF